MTQGWMLNNLLENLSIAKLLKNMTNPISV